MTTFLRLFVFLVVLALVSVGLLSCNGLRKSRAQSSQAPQAPGALQGVLMWKGDPSGIGLYSSETSLTPANVNPTGFGLIGQFPADGLIAAQPLYVSNVKMSDGSSHNVIILATEHDTVFAIDPDAPSAAPLWQRSYIDPANGITTMGDVFGDQSAFDGEVGITGTPYIDSATGAVYFVTTLLNKGTPEQWLRAIDIRTGNDYGPGSVKIAATVHGDGQDSVNGQIAFDPSIHNQRAGLMKDGTNILVAWGSFSDWGVYHGWLMAFDASSLQLTAASAVFNSTTQFQLVDPSTNQGYGGAFWQGGAAPSIDAKGSIYVNAANGSFNANSGGKNYGDTMLKLQLSGSGFQLLDTFTPSNTDCFNENDLELGSGGVALLPTDSFNTAHLAAAFNKEGRLFIVNRDHLGGFNAAGDTQIPLQFMVGTQTCAEGLTDAVTEGPTWNRLYGNPAYWNGYLYAGASNAPLKQYQFQNGLPNPTPLAVSQSSFGYRGGNIVVSANGNQNGIVWVSEKYVGDQAILHAYDATNVATELWNSNMNADRDAMGIGVAFSVPVVANGRVLAASETMLDIYGLLK